MFTAALSPTLSVSAAAGSSFTISASFRALTVTAPWRRHPRRDGHAGADLEIGGGHADGLVVALQQDVGEDGQRLPRLDDVLDHLDAAEERLALKQRLP